MAIYERKAGIVKTICTNDCDKFSVSFTHHNMSTDQSLLCDVQPLYKAVV